MSDGANLTENLIMDFFFIVCIHSASYNATDVSLNKHKK